MADTYCTDCNRSTEVVFDHSSGDTICSECGLVIEAHFIDETSEWRTFANDSTNNDPIRVGGPTNPLLDDVALSTIISKPITSKPTDHLLSSSLGRWQIRNNTSLITAFHTIDTMSDRLGLVAIIKDRACEIYKKMEDLKSIGGKNRDAMLAACLYVSCRQEDKPRTMKEIASVANGATRKEIGRAKEYIVKHLGAENVGQTMEMGTIHAVDFMRRFCSNLQMTSQEIKASQEVVKKSEAFDIRRSPISVAAAVIYMISQLSDHKKLIKDISIATGVAEGTIRNTYNDLYPYASRLIPSSFAREEDLKNLCSPCAER